MAVGTTVVVRIKAGQGGSMRLLMDKRQFDTPRGIRFVLGCRLEASPEEVDSLRRYLPKYRFGRHHDVWDLLDHEVVYEATDVKEVTDRADDMKKAGRKLSRRLQAAQRYEGRETVEI